MPQFVLLEHDHPELHWDFMLEHGDVLLTWRLDRIPTLACEIAAMHLPDHRKAYLDYEGPISGNRGLVTRIDRGNFELLASSAGDLTARLQGTTLQGSVRLSKISPHSSRDESDWRMIWQPD